MTASFSRAAYAYDSSATVQRVVGSHLARLVGELTLPEHPVVLEIGCGTGLFTRSALSCLDPTLWLATDISLDMIKICRGNLTSDTRVLFTCMDGEVPATLSTGFDLVCTNLAVQWFDDLAGTLEKLAHLVKRNGWLAFTTLMAGTFSEWIDIHERLGLVAGTPSYPDETALQHQLPQGGSGTVISETFLHTYPDAYSFVSTLKRIGACVAVPNRRPLTPGTFRRVLRAFDVNRSSVTVSYYVGYGLWKRNC